MNLPNEKTIKVFQLRVKYLYRRVQDGKTLSSYEQAEMAAIDATLNLIYLIRDRIPENIIANAIRNAYAEIKQKEKTEQDEEPKNKTLLDYFEKKLDKKTILQVEINQDTDGIITADISQRLYKNDALKWVGQRKATVTKEVLQEILDALNGNRTEQPEKQTGRIKATVKSKGETHDRKTEVCD